MPAAIFDHFGPPDQVLTVGERPSRALRAGEVRVQMLAAPINPSDIMTIRGVYGRLPDLPAVPGYEGVGLVTETNAGLWGRYLKKRRVAVLLPLGGSWQSEVILPARQAIPLPNELPLATAATSIVNPLTALMLLTGWLKVPRGAWLAQTAAASTLGRMIIRLAKSRGIRTINVVRRNDQIEMLRQEGADEVVVWNGATDAPTALTSAIRQVCPDGVPYAIDAVGGPIVAPLVRALAPRGRLILYGSLSEESAVLPIREVLTAGIRVEGFWLANALLDCGGMARVGWVREVLSLVRSGVLATDRTVAFPLEQVQTAIAASIEPNRREKVLLSLSDAAARELNLA